MTDFQREILKERENIFFHYEKSDINIKLTEEIDGDDIKKLIYINPIYYYYFDLSRLEKESLNSSDFSFKHEIQMKIYINELKKNSNLSNLTDEEIAEYISEKVYTKEFKDVIFNIGLVEAISYYKIIPVKNFIVMGELNEYQKKWWSKLIFKGLGEYRYLNDLLSIDEENFINIISNQPIDNASDINIDNEVKYINIEKEGFLIPVGGGKDSTVTLELMKQFKNINTIFAVGLKGARKDTIEKAEYSKYEIVETDRIFDNKLLDRVEDGYFNGHIPFSSVLAFISLLSALILNKKYIVLSNELSANEPTVYEHDINHQYSKSIEFEKDFREYVDLMNIDIEYFSILRPLTEVAIARLFSKYTKYHKVFNSCNVGSKGENWIWCCDCPKCLFSYIILSPFLYKEQLVSIYGKDVFENERLLEDMLKLIGKADTKPFECVGTKSETIFSLNRLMEKLEVAEETKNLPFLLDKYKEIYLKEKNKTKSKLEEKEISNNKISENINLYFVYNNDNFLPDFLENIVKESMQEKE